MHHQIAFRGYMEFLILFSLTLWKAPSPLCYFSSKAKAKCMVGPFCRDWWENMRLILGFQFRKGIQLAFNSGSLPDLVKHNLPSPLHIQIYFSSISCDKHSYYAEEQPLETWACCSWVTVGKALLHLCFCPLNNSKAWAHHTYFYETLHIL